MLYVYMLYTHVYICVRARVQILKNFLLVNKTWLRIYIYIHIKVIKYNFSSF